MLNSKHYAQNIGLVIKQLREEKGLTQIVLPEEIGKNRTYLSRIENGEKAPGLTSLVLITVTLDLSQSTLILKAEQLN